MKIVAKTDIGLQRESNQDSYAAGELPGAVAWAVVCDGMGGAAGGNFASSTAVKVISERITSSYRDGMSASSIRNMLTSAIAAANISVYDMSKADPELTGMGTTVVVAIVVDNNVFIAHAGDSRAYILSDGSLNQLTKDHSIVQEMIDNGTLTPDEAKIDPRKNIITRALGVDYELRIDFDIADIGEKDVLILCTDGLTNFVEPQEIYELTDDGKFYEYAERLVDRANSNGGGDNITVVTMSY
ncbi:MAG: Stp1/IreP family PP2C-type Ser/Thr phosphatase [Clostridia bacterium]|nr:Stp1/IreP family PP2C-type Ser/Thr phosphatase [Clostridia bacterium]